MGVYQFALTGLTLLGICLGTASCLFAGDSQDTDISPQTIETIDNTSQLRDAEDRVRVVLPPGWQEAPEKTLHDSADLYAKHEDQELYLVVVGESRSAIQAGSEELIAYRYRQIILDALDDYREPTATQADAVGGYPTVQYEIRGTLDSNDIVYLHTTVFVDDQVYQVVGWTTAAKYERHRDELQEIISSFRPV
ncbi:hypothetical protein C7271_20165 [filamentous cyanobacterium CCP5]|nr:hypothetical protein C7271_20165 [filamentous cyanobacterium CCP5]